MVTADTVGSSTSGGSSTVMFTWLEYFQSFLALAHLPRAYNGERLYAARLQREDPGRPRPGWAPSRRRAAASRVLEPRRLALEAVGQRWRGCRAVKITSSFTN